MKELKIFRKFLNEGEKMADMDFRPGVGKDSTWAPTLKQQKAAEKEKRKKDMQGLEEYGGAEFDEETAKRNMFAAKYNKPGDTERFRSYMVFLSDLKDSGKTNMLGAAPYLQAEFNLDKKEARDLLAYWMGSYRNMDEGSCGYTPDGKPRSKPAGPDLMKEFVGAALEKRNEPLYDKLVPGQGNSDFIEGEMLRAINRIIYRWYNDGDYFYKGYGAETAGPAHSFLTNSSEIPFELQATLSSIFSKAIDAPEDGYERLLKFALEKILDYIESKDGNYTESSEDMFKYESEFEDEEDYEDDYDDDYDDEYEDEY